MSDQLHERGKALEGNFFRELDQKLLEDLRAEMQAQEQKQALQSASGIEDEETLDKLVQIGISPEVLTSFSLLPLVSVAWADGVVQDSERDAIMKAAATAGIVSDSAGFQVLQSWLAAKPNPEVLDSWKSYIGSLKAALDHAAFAQLKEKVIGRAREVAQAAGGFLGLGGISPSETAVLAELEEAF